MAQILNPNLTLSAPFNEGGQLKVTIQVTYNAVFSEVERNLITSSGFICEENIQVIGVDFGVPGEILINRVFPVQNIPVTVGSGPLTVPRTRTIKALRSLLQEDSAPFDADEISCKIQLSSVFGSGQFTPVRTLAG
jgi:hypothetical protein